ncbi:hypothetical protein SAMN02910418_01327 [Bowdeniella nasicola]|uniref:DUF5596 domain-containing protein n=1 Tax=Bowdeniella nasicola TaxID=208480 RepID=A0A1H4A4R0_9ACTO|nr:acyltransferase domain-containing protein [Bowdeniella nasicola]SEA30965.1 hypothetical protein SAMN02910418_01327 [Bowdeniella nasicola]
MDSSQVRERLARSRLGPIVDELGFDTEDVAELFAALAGILSDDAEVSRIGQAAGALHRAVGLETEPAPLPAGGLTALVAHLVAIEAPRAFHRSRGITSARSSEALADLAQQVRVHRRTFGELGLHTLPWTSLLYTGRLYTLGRLQFDLHRGPDGRWRLGTHIPATGPLLPEAVNDSFAEASEFFPRHFPDLARGNPEFARTFWCDSWLLNPALEEITPGSNLAHFARRWRITESVEDVDGVVFFVFDRRPPYDLEDLPSTTRLERAIRERLLDGRGWHRGIGTYTPNP